MTAERCYNYTPEPALTALIYCRVSSRKQMSEGDGLNSQEHRCRQHAAQKGYAIENVFLESVSGGLDIADRPALQTLLHYLDAMKATGKKYVVIFDDHKRFARHTEMHLRLKKEMAQRNAKIEYLNVTVDDSPEGEFIETMLAAQAQLERQQNARQVRQKTKARLEKGFWTFRAPVGYKYVKSKHGGKELVLNEPLASIIKEALEGFACGRFASQTEVKRFLETQPDFAAAMPSGKVWVQNVAQMLDQILYTGHFEAKSYNVPLRKGVHEPLISLKTFEKIQQLVKGNSNLSARKNIGRDFALRGAVCCHDCDVPLRSGWTKGRSKLYPYYRCQTKTCAYYGKSVARAELESMFADLLKSIQPAPQFFVLVRDMFRDAWHTQSERVLLDAQASRSEIAKAEKEIDTLVKRIMATDNQRVISAYEDRIDELEKSKLVWADKASQKPPKDDTFFHKVEPALLLLANPYKLWASGSFEVKRIVLKMAVQGKILYHWNEPVSTALKPLHSGGFMGVFGGQVKDGGFEWT